MNSTHNKNTKISNYLSAVAGVSCISSSATAATIVTFYGVDSANDTNPDPAGINIGGLASNFLIDNTFSSDSYFQISGTGSGYFSTGSDISGSGYGSFVNYHSYGLFAGGAVSGVNYANVSFNGQDGVYEAVAQFFLDGAGNGRLIAIAENDDFTALSISEGVAAIDAASVPEPSGLSLLALGAIGLTARRNRKMAS